MTTRFWPTVSVLCGLTTLTFFLLYPEQEEPHPDPESTVSPEPVVATEPYPPSSGELGQTISPVPAQEVERASSRSNAFAVDVFKELAQNEGNLLFSPVSLVGALGMTSAGAHGTTATEMNAVLHFPDGDGQGYKAFGALLRTLDGRTKDTHGYELSIANRLWGQAGFLPLPGYLALIDKHFGAEFIALDFKGEQEKSRKLINRWVEDRTQERIQELLQPGAVGRNTKLVLTNAVYFKGEWEERFEVKATKLGPFYINPRRSVQAPLMSTSGKYASASADLVKLLELPYKENGLSMIVVLPEAGVTLGVVEESLTSEMVIAWLKQLNRKEETLVTLPRFSLTAPLSLRSTLGALGMKDAFSSNAADFGGIVDTRTQRIHISDVVHQSFIVVNEEGTEAAAATAVLQEDPSLPPRFRANRPFLFLLIEKRTGVILFMGRLVDPS